MNQLLVHLLGDFWLQNDWMALNKSKKILPCLIHVLIYTSCFLLLTTSWKALLIIGVTHFIIDHWHTPLKRLIWFKNNIGYNDYPEYKKCDTTGYCDDYGSQSLEEKDKKFQRPFCISIWLYIAQDNCLHLIINYLALKFLG